jgi:hypothetical protein
MSRRRPFVHGTIGPVTRDEGIAWLQERGYRARERRWFYSKTEYGDGIFACNSVDGLNNIRVAVGALIIYPRSNIWVVDCSRWPVDQYGGPLMCREFDRLEDALECAREWIDNPPPMPDER